MKDNPVYPHEVLRFPSGKEMKNRFMLALLTNTQSHADGIPSDNEFNWLTMIARGQLEIEFPIFTYIDFMHVLKIDGNWKIVSKIFTKREKE